MYRKVFRHFNQPLMRIAAKAEIVFFLCVGVNAGSGDVFYSAGF